MQTSRHQQQWAYFIREEDRGFGWELCVSVDDGTSWITTARAGTFATLEETEADIAYFRERTSSISGTRTEQVRRAS